MALLTYATRAEFYRAETAGQYIDSWYPLTSSERGGDVLQVPCGAGRDARALADWASRSTFVDSEPVMVAAASGVLPSVDAKVVQTLVADLRGFDLGAKFDFIFVPDGVLRLYDEQDVRRIGRSLAAHLSSDGRVIVAPARPVAEIAVQLPDGTRLVRTRQATQRRGMLHVRFRYRSSRDDGTCWEDEASYLLQPRTGGELVSALASHLRPAGLLPGKALLLARRASARGGVP